MRIDDLDSRQRDVVNTVLHSNDKLLVLGGPGAGKTTTALWSARTYLEASSENPAPRALFLTFSRSAVSQIMSRSPGVLVGCADRVEVLTFHGLAYRVVKAFGRYAGYGLDPPSIQSEARSKLLGQDRTKLRYADLIPGAMAIANDSERVRRLLASRWGLVICDEAQDTSTEQLRFLRIIASRKLLLLGDPNQMIYTFIDGVSPERFRKLREWVDTEIELSPRSHRDPSGAIPAVAEAIRQRLFDHEAVVEALTSGRLVIHFDVSPDGQTGLLAEVIKEARRLNSRDIGIFAHSNAAVAELAEKLDAADIDHVIVGIPEAHAEAMASMSEQCAFALGLTTNQELRESFGLFLTAATRQRGVPEMARAIAGGHGIPSQVMESLEQLEGSLIAAVDGTTGELVEIAMESWEGLGIRSGIRPWHRAAQHFSRLLRPLWNLPVSEETVGQLREIVERSRMEALIDLDYSERGTVKLMNYHQTKGREADTVVHVFQTGDYFGSEREPFEKASRLLNVAISRARHRVIVLLPPMPHAVVHPYTMLRGYTDQRLAHL